MDGASRDTDHGQVQCRSPIRAQIIKDPHGACGVGLPTGYPTKLGTCPDGDDSSALRKIVEPLLRAQIHHEKLDLFEQHPGKMKEIIQLLFREFEEGMEFLALEDDEKSDR